MIFPKKFLRYKCSDAADEERVDVIRRLRIRDADVLLHADPDRSAARSFSFSCAAGTAKRVSRLCRRRRGIYPKGFILLRFFCQIIPPPAVVPSLKSAAFPHGFWSFSAAFSCDGFDLTDAIRSFAFAR